MARPAYVLPESAVAGTAAVNFPGFPGSWTPGSPIAAAELVAHGGFADEDALAERVAELGLPLEQVEVTGDDGEMPIPPNHVQSQADAVAEALEERPKRRSHKDLDEQARELGFEFSKPGKELTVAEKQAEIDAHIAGTTADNVTPLDEPPTEPLTDEDA